MREEQLRLQTRRLHAFFYQELCALLDHLEHRHAASLARLPPGSNKKQYETAVFSISSGYYPAGLAVPQRVGFILPRQEIMTGFRVIRVFRGS